MSNVMPSEKAYFFQSVVHLYGLHGYNVAIFIVAQQSQTIISQVGNALQFFLCNLSKMINVSR